MEPAGRPPQLVLPETAREDGPDETEAGAARRRLRDGPLPRLEPEPCIAEALLPGEWVVAMRQPAVLERRQAAVPATAGLPGTLFLTTSRLLHVGRRRIAYDVTAIREAVVVGDSRLLLMLGDGVGVQLDVERPRLLRVEIAAVRRRLDTTAP